MEMTIDDAIETLKDTNSYGTADIAKSVAIDTMHKYQKIAYLINQAEYAGENSYTGENEWILADKTYQKIQEMLKNENDN